MLFWWILHLFSSISAPSSPFQDIDELKINKTFIRDDISRHSESQLPEGGKIWAFLFSGSKGWDDYRHQADVCHAYQVLRRQGVPEEQIVVMMYDDVAYHENNANSGVISNGPSNENVYEGVPKDYTGQDVTPENVLKILQGRNMSGIGSGKTIRSGPKDHVFVYMAVHGGPGVLFFTVDGLNVLSAKELNDAIVAMHNERKYKNMVLYLEACFAGSIFDEILQDNINVYATTASNSNELSYAYYYDKALQTFVGDEYSTAWMEDSDTSNSLVKTLGEQFEIVRELVNRSHVMEYGDMKMRYFKLADFQGSVVTTPSQSKFNFTRIPGVSVPAPDVAVEILKRKIDSARTMEQKERLEEQLRKLLEGRDAWNKQFLDFLEYLGSSAQPRGIEVKPLLKKKRTRINFDCYIPLLNYYSLKCSAKREDPYLFSLFYIFVNICEAKIPIHLVFEAMNYVCKPVSNQ